MQSFKHQIPIPVAFFRKLLLPPVPCWGRYGTTLYRGYVQQRPRRTPFEVDKVGGVNGGWME